MLGEKLARFVAIAAFLGAGLHAIESDAKTRWTMQSTYPGTLPQLGTLGKEFSERIEKVSGGEIRIEFQEPGAFVPAFETFEAVSIGAIEAGWSTPGYWAGKVPALQLFAAVPFGPDAAEYMAWFYFGGGKEMFEEIYHRHNIHSVMCGIIAPEASGWFKEEIKTVDDLRGKKMRIFGLGALVMEKLGVSTQLLDAGEIYQALELGTIDAAEFSMPAIDLERGFHEVAKHYYFPGWHQQSTFFDLMMNKDAWDALSRTEQAQIETTCGDAVRHALAEGEYIQFGALKELKAKGVAIHRWPPEILAALKAAWHEVATEMSEKDPDFARAWESLSRFRADYKTWEDLGYLE